MSDESIVLYVVPNCPLCREAKSWLDSRGIEYDAQDVQNDYGAMRRMYKLTQQGLVPVLSAGGKVAVRPTEQELVSICQGVAD